MSLYYLKPILTSKYKILNPKNDDAFCENGYSGATFDTLQISYHSVVNRGEILFIYVYIHNCIEAVFNILALSLLCKRWGDRGCQ